VVVELTSWKIVNNFTVDFGGTDNYITTTETGKYVAVRDSASIRVYKYDFD